MAAHGHGAGPLTRRRPVDFFKSLPLLRDIKASTATRCPETFLAGLLKLKRGLLLYLFLTLVQGLVFEEELGDELAQAKKKKIIDLPTPAVSDVSDYTQFTKGGYVPPAPYIRRPVSRDIDDASSEYDIDFEDEVCLGS